MPAGEAAARLAPFEALALALQSERFKQACRLPPRENQLTSLLTQGALCELVRLLAPANVLEIGTYFADTAAVIARVMGEETGGHLTTIDPFGGHRVPQLIEAWPEHVRDHVTFKPEYSMSFFSQLEGSNPSRGKNAPFDIVFIDGNHSFHYALFDINQSAEFCRPGGALVADNINQAGPAQAVRAFLADHRCWELFKLRDSDTTSQEFCPAAHAAIILAPAGIEIGSTPSKFLLRDLPITKITRLTLRLQSRSGRGELTATTNLHVIPLDNYLTGTGMQSSVAHGSRVIDAGAPDVLAIEFDPPLMVHPRSSNDPVNAEIELQFVRTSPDAHLLLDANRPIELSA